MVLKLYEKIEYIHIFRAVFPVFRKNGQRYEIFVYGRFVGKKICYNFCLKCFFEKSIVFEILAKNCFFPSKMAKNWKGTKSHECALFQSKTRCPNTTFPPGFMKPPKRSLKCLFFCLFAWTIL